MISGLTGNALLRGTLGGGGGGAVSDLQYLKSLYTGGYIGPCYIPRMSDMYQDSAGTTPVTAYGQPIGLHKDAFGRAGHDRYQNGLVSKRPTYVSGGLYGMIDYDGNDDTFATSSISFGSDSVTYISALHKDLSSSTQISCELSLSSSSGYSGAFRTLVDDGSGGLRFGSRGDGGVSQAIATFGTSSMGIVTGYAKISADLCRVRINNLSEQQAGADQGNGNYGNWPLFFGARAGTSLYFNGQEAFVFIINRLLSATELTNVAKISAKYAGITI